MSGSALRRPLYGELKAQGRMQASRLQSSFNNGDFFDNNDDSKVSSQVAKLNALAAKLRAEAAELEVS